MSSEKFLTPAEVCEILSCTPHSFRELVNSRALTAYRLNSRTTRVLPSDLKAFLDKSKSAQEDADWVAMLEAEQAANAESRN